MNWCVLRGGVPDWARRTACSSNNNAIEFEKLDEAQCRWCSVFVLVLDTGIIVTKASNMGDREYPWHFAGNLFNTLVSPMRWRITSWAARTKVVASRSLSSSQSFTRKSPRASMKVNRTLYSWYCVTQVRKWASSLCLWRVVCTLPSSLNPSSPVLDLYQCASSLRSDTLRHPCELLH